MKRRLFQNRRLAYIFLLPAGVTFFILSSIFFIACSPNQRIIESSAEHTEPTSDVRPTPTPSFEKDIEAMKTAQFLFIYVFRRKDGQPLDADDKRYAARVIPPEMNRRTISDEGKAIIVGSNYRMPDETLKVLKQRFEFGDFSPEADKSSERSK